MGFRESAVGQRTPVFAPTILSNIALKKSYADVFYRQKPAYEAGFLLYGTFADDL
jgi:hypothetical protein